MDDDTPQSERREALGAKMTAVVSTELASTQEAETVLAEGERATALRDALAAASAISDEWSRAQVLTELAPHLPEALFPDALAAARAISDEWSRAQVLTALAPYL